VVGSIGAIIVHSEISRALDEDGVAVRIFRSGDRKMRGNSMEVLDERAAAKCQALVDEAGDTFARLVSLGRSMDLEAVLATEADTFTGNNAVEIGLIDAVLSKRDAWSRLEEETDRIKRQRRNAP
jgi:ClpP class serine protease